MAEDVGPAAAAGPSPGVAASLAAWWSAVHAALADAVEIALLESRAAAVRLGLIIASGILFGLLVASAWLLLVASMASVGVEAGLSVAGALGLASLANLALLVPLVWFVRWLARGVRFDATVRQFGLAAGSAPTDPTDTPRTSAG